MDVPRPAAWAVVMTQPNREAVARQNLVRQQFEVYGPVVLRRVRHARRTQEVLRPLFPGYLFVGFDRDGATWRAINSTLGVRALVRSGDQVSWIDGEFIDGLRSREIDGVISRAASTFTAGQNVRMADGAFDGLIAKILEVDEKNRLVVLMEFLNRSVRIRVEHTQVLPL
jgi:transcriptional antiterminator RfaH